jgi:hypothetical protein
MSADQAMADGVQKFLAQLASLPVGSRIVTPADIVKVFQDRIDAGKALKTAEAARTAAVKADRDVRAQTSVFVQACRRVVQGMFFESPDTLAAFGLKAPKAAKKKVAVKAAAVVKSKATRTARNTLGKKAKLAIHGSPSTAKSSPTAAPEAPAKPTT